MVALTKIGIPFDVAHAMTWEEAMGYLIAAGELEGGSWDWKSMGWEERS